MTHFGLIDKIMNQSLKNIWQRYSTIEPTSNEIKHLSYPRPVPISTYLTSSVSLSRLLIHHSTQKTSVIGMKRFQDVLSLYSTYIACYRAGKIELVWHFQKLWEEAKGGRKN